MTADHYEMLATRAARLAATSTTQDEANHWWDECQRYETLAQHARTTEETR